MAAETDKEIQLVVITGMSGAGKSVAMQSLEDLGYFASISCRLSCPSWLSCWSNPVEN